MHRIVNTICIGYHHRVMYIIIHHFLKMVIVYIYIGWISLKPQQQYIPSSNAYMNYMQDDNHHNNTNGNVNVNNSSHTGSAHSMQNANTNINNGYNSDRNNLGGMMNINDGTITHFTNVNTVRTQGSHHEEQQPHYNTNSSIS